MRMSEGWWALNVVYAQSGDLLSLKSSAASCRVGEADRSHTCTAYNCSARQQSACSRCTDSSQPAAAALRALPAIPEHIAWTDLVTMST